MTKDAADLRILTLPLIFCIRFYQAVISPVLGAGKCRFYPTCSHYAEEAVERYGAIVGIWLAVRRLLKCGPWHAGGYDPVPQPKELASRKWIGLLLKDRSKLRKVR